MADTRRVEEWEQDARTSEPSICRRPTRNLNPSANERARAVYRVAELSPRRRAKPIGSTRRPPRRSPTTEPKAETRPRALTPPPSADLAVEEWRDITSVRERPPRHLPPPPPAEAFEDSQAADITARRSEVPFLGDPTHAAFSGGIASWLGIEDDVTDNDRGLLPPLIEGRLERAHRRARQGRAVQMEIEIREAVAAARCARVRIPRVRLRAIEIPCYRRAAKECLKLAKRAARRGDVSAVQSALLSSRHYASLGESNADERAIRRVLRKANTHAYAAHARDAQRYAADGDLAMTKMAVARAQVCLAAAVANGAKRRSDELEGFKLRARLNSIRNRNAAGLPASGL